LTSLPTSTIPPLASFLGSLDFSNVEAVGPFFLNAGADEMQLDGISTPLVPEPSSVTYAVLAFVGSAAVFRRRRRNR
jgi:hypothetical protein